MKKNGFTMVELIAIVVIMACILLVVLPAVNNTIKNSEEKKKEEALNNIYMAAENYLMANYDNYKIDNVGDIVYVNITDLISNNYMSIDTLNPNNNSTFSNKDAVKVTRNEDGTFSYELVLIKTIYDVVIEDYPELITKGNGCVTPGDNNYSYMGGCYLKGNPDNNYIWYSGFLWRIMGINADGTLRLITEENVTAIPWGAEDTAQNWDGSYAKEWLNNYFYSRLKGNNIIVEQTWCSEITTDSASARTICANNLSKEKSKVGLITVDEYNLSLDKSNTTYLNVGTQVQWTITPYDGSNLLFYDGVEISKVNMLNFTAGIRAIININPNITSFKGNGVLVENWNDKTGPYIFEEDKVNNSKKLTELSTSGEYVMFAGKKYRIIDKDTDKNIKLILDGYYEEVKGTPYKMIFGNNSNFTKDSGIGDKLNTDVLNWLVTSSDTKNRSKLVNDYTWYQNNFDYGQSYTISLNEDNTTSSNNATVGLIRVGEILSSQSSSILTKGYTTTSNYNNAIWYWTITPYANASVWRLFDVGYTNPCDTVTGLGGIRPVIVIKSDVEIIGGTGTFSDPYQI